jgi:hypothetical protein
MNKVVEVKQNLGQSRKGITPGYVSQLGNKVGDHVTREPGTTGYRGEPMRDGRTGISVPLGNQLTNNVGVGGPGKGRTVYASGSQDQHGGVAGSPRPAGRGILNNE